MELKAVCICPNLNEVNPSLLSKYAKEYADFDIIVFPEYIHEVKKFDIEPQSDALVVWGSKIETGKNVSPITSGANQFNYDKQKLTPWENQLDAGSEPLLIEHKGVKIGIQICFDIEFPELSQAYRGVDVLLVPSATETELGYERVSRCASARSVELGCAVVTCHLIGETTNDLIDVNVGNHNLFLPSQSLFENEIRDKANPVEKKGPIIQEFFIPIDKIRQQRDLTDETNPSI